MTDNMFMVNYDKKYNKYIFYDKNNTNIGEFNINQFIKYLILPLYNDFDNNTILNNSTYIIETFICKNIFDDNTFVESKLNNYINSPFISNINMLIKLNNDIITYKNNHLNNHLINIMKGLINVFIANYFLNWAFQICITRIYLMVSRYDKNISVTINTTSGSLCIMKNQRSSIIPYSVINVAP